MMSLWFVSSPWRPFLRWVFIFSLYFITPPRLGLGSVAGLGCLPVLGFLTSPIWLLSYLDIGPQLPRFFLSPRSTARCLHRLRLTWGAVRFETWPSARSGASFLHILLPVALGPAPPPPLRDTYILSAFGHPPPGAELGCRARALARSRLAR